jgi:hypothetical protein
MVNMKKSSIHFAKGCNSQVREEIKGLLNIHTEALSDKYLGMQRMWVFQQMGHSNILKTGSGAGFRGWMEKCLSAGGKEVLIKSVAQAIPTYSMSCFKLPRGLCQHVDILMRSFW